MSKKYVVAAMEVAQNLKFEHSIRSFHTESEAFQYMVDCVDITRKNIESTAEELLLNRSDLLSGITCEISSKDAHFNYGGKYSWYWFISEVKLENRTLMDRTIREAKLKIALGEWTIDYAKGRCDIVLEREMALSNIQSAEEYEDYMEKIAELGD